MQRAAAALLMTITCATPAASQQVRVSEPVVHHSSQFLYTGSDLDGATVYRSAEGSAMVWYETLSDGEQPTLFFAPLRADGSIEPSAARPVLPSSGAAASAGNGREVLIASADSMLVYDVTGYLRNVFSLPPVELSRGPSRPISAAIVDGEYRSAVLNEARTLDIRSARDTVHVETEPWNFAADLVTLFSGRDATLVAEVNRGCVLLFDTCNYGFNVALKSPLHFTYSRRYDRAEPASAPAIAFDGRSFLLAWAAHAKNCGDEASASCNAIRFGRLSADGVELDGPAGTLLGSSAVGPLPPETGAVAAVWNGRYYVVVWQSDLKGGWSDLRGAVISSIGVVAATFDVAATPRTEIRPSLSVSPSGAVTVTYLSGKDWRIESRTVVVTESRARAVRR